jgi:hypothetical protein
VKDDDGRIHVTYGLLDTRPHFLHAGCVDAEVLVEDDAARIALLAKCYRQL